MTSKPNKLDVLRQWRLLTIAALSVFAMAGNLVGPTVFENVGPADDPLQYIASFFLGALLAEACLLGIWCALGTQPIKYRLPITCGLAAFGTWAFVVGLQLSDIPPMPWQVAVLVVLAGLAQ